MRFLLGGTTGVRPNDSASRRVGSPFVGAVHEQPGSRERAERGHGAAPVGRVVLVARAQMDFDERRLAVGYHVNFGVPSSPGDPDGLGAPFSGAPVACWWTFTLVESNAGTRTSTAMIRSSCNAVNLSLIHI